jgi:hypothetical protein
VKASRWLTGVAAAGAVAGLLVVGTGDHRAAAAADGPSSLVEDYKYPGAAEILAQHNVELVSGDGHIVFVTSHPISDDVRCDVGQIAVEKHLNEEPWDVFYCFRTIGSAGVLKLKIPGTFGLRGGDKPVVATAQLADGKEKEYDVPANGSVAVDPGQGNEAPTAILVELRFG